MLRMRITDLAIMLVLWAAAAPAVAQTGGLTGKATLADGTPCVKCRVLIERLDIKENYPTKTDHEGNYSRIGLPVGLYRVTLQDPQGTTLTSVNRKHIGIGSPTELDFDLRKQPAAKQKALEPRRAGAPDSHPRPFR